LRKEFGILQDVLRRNIVIEPVEEKNFIKIGVIGVGGAGCNAINHMIEAGLKGAEFYAVNTDIQALQMNLAQNKIQIGAQITGGLGSGGDPEIGRKACEESVELLREIFTGLDMIFIATGEGGGTGTGATPLVAETAKAQGALVVAVVTKPFAFEGRSRARKALTGLETLKDKVDTLIVIPNQKLLTVHGEKSAFEAFRLADEVLLNAARGISEIVTSSQMINIDFADVRSVMMEKGGALMTIGTAGGDGRATEAAHNAISSPLIEDINIGTAKKVLLNITGGDTMSLHEVNEAATVVHNATNGEADIRLGAARDRSFKEMMKVTVIATGIEEALPRPDEVCELLRSDEIFPVRRRRIRQEVELSVDKTNLEIPTFLRRQLD